MEKVVVSGKCFNGKVVILSDSIFNGAACEDSGDMSGSVFISDYIMDMLPTPSDLRISVRAHGFFGCGKPRHGIFEDGQCLNVNCIPFETFNHFDIFLPVFIIGKPAILHISRNAVQIKVV